MLIPIIPKNENKRLAALRNYNILDTISESEYDEITMLASQICNTPIALVSLVDDKRQWFKSNHGLIARETPRDFSFCAHAINNKEDVFVIKDSRLDLRFFDNPLVTSEPHVIFYAGVPLVSFDGNALGTLCVIDNTPRELSNDQLRALQALSNQVMAQLELRRKNQILTTMYDELHDSYHEMEQFAAVAAHDIKSPLHNITSLMNIVIDENMGVNSDGKIYLGLALEASQQLTCLVDDILTYTKATQAFIIDLEELSLNTLIADIVSLLSPPEEVTIVPPAQDLKLTSSLIALKQILMNIMNNAIKYNSKPGAKITIAATEQEENYVINVTDNGPGIPEKDLRDIFELFKTVKGNANSGTGIGLAIVKKLVNKLRGQIEIKSTLGVGTEFIITLPKP